MTSASQPQIETQCTQDKSSEHRVDPLEETESSAERLPQAESEDDFDKFLMEQQKMMKEAYGETAVCITIERHMLMLMEEKEID